MQISTGKGETFRNRGGSITFPGLYQPHREDKHYKETPKSRSQIMNLRRVRAYMRSGDRKKRGIGAGALGIIIVFLFVLFVITLALLGVPLHGSW